MNILWLSWKDTGHPGAGGAEVVMHQLCKRLITEGHSVTILTARYPGSKPAETVDGMHIVRVGNNRYTHSFVAVLHYARNMRNQFDVVVEAVNTAPYFSVFFRDTAKKALFYHQLAREIWFHEAPAGMSHLGYYVLEPLATRLLGKSKAKTITISDSTSKDLAKYGFNPAKTAIISQGIELAPLQDLASVHKYATPTMLSLGAMRAMKRTLEQIKAFELAKDAVPNLKLKVAGDTSGAYGETVLNYIAKSPYKDDIEVLGRVSDEKRLELMQKCHFIAVTSLKEGWGLIVTEAASQGTPAIVYDVDGLRDSVKNGETGIVVPPKPTAMAEGIATLLQDKALYQTMRQAGWEWSKRITFDQAYKDFVKTLEIT